MLSQAVSQEMQSLPSIFNRLEPKDKLEAIIKLLPYLLPKAEASAEKSKTPQEAHNDFVTRITAIMNDRKRQQEMGNVNLNG